MGIIYYLILTELNETMICDSKIYVLISFKPLILNK